MTASASAADASSAPLLDEVRFDKELKGADSPLGVFKQTLRDAGERLVERFHAGIPAQVLVHQRAELIDQVLLRAWARHGLDQVPNLALVAVGGYGRGELHPCSDVDLLILMAEASPETEAALPEFVTFLWDIGLEVGHSVRTLAQCVSEAEQDITVATNLMEARLLDGPEALFEQMRESTGRKHIWPSRRFFEAKWQEQVSRHHRFDDTAYNLEPNIKEGPGGLRDIQMIGWVVKRHFGAETLNDLVTQGFLTETEYQSLIECQNHLWQVRFALHTLTGRREDRLLFDFQRALAEQFGYHDQEHNLAVEQFMKSYYRTIGELGRLNEMLLELFQEAILYADAPAEILPINKRFQARNGFLEVTHPRVFARYPFALLELFLVMQQHPELRGVRASTIRLVRDHRYLIDDKFRGDIRARSLFLEFVRQPRGITHELRRMHRYGVLAAYVPQFEHTVGLMQYDLFHVYTVDEHTLFVVRNLRSFAVPERYHEFPLCSAIFQRIPKPSLLYLAGLFHDIAKGRGGDHSELGADEALEFCVRHGLGQYDARLVAWLVRHHLLMSTTAQRQDIYDPDVVNTFARKVGDLTHLDYLYLLTVADIRGTNPKLWNDWKDALLRELYHSTQRALRRGIENPIDRSELAEETRTAARRHVTADGVHDARIETLWHNLGDDYFLRFSPDEVAWHTRAIVDSNPHDLPLILSRRVGDRTEIFVYARDQDFLFAATTSVLDRLGLNILDARILTGENEMTLDSYVVMEESGASIPDRQREEAIRAALREQLRTPGDAVYPINRLPKRQLKHFSTATEVNFFPDPSNGRTIMEVVTGDRPGLLSRLAWAMVTCDARLQNAKIATFGERAEDIFFITDHENRPVSAEVEQQLRRKIVEVLEPE